MSRKIVARDLTLHARDVPEAKAQNKIIPHQAGQLDALLNSSLSKHSAMLDGVPHARQHSQLCSNTGPQPITSASR
ncbi:hypothetical protein [Nocardia sp. CA-145437]|uniref:hypothetical protein n=1 Tax=Nocardia sp. CA-145437 TaxID=3239980 RepID=UPI003D9602AB